MSQRADAVPVYPESTGLCTFHVEYCKKEICEKYGIKKVSAVAPGGKERYESVWKALCILKERGQSVPGGMGLAFVLDENGFPFYHPRLYEYSADSGFGRRACDVPAL